MKPGAQIVLAAAARFYAPLIVLLGVSVLVARAPGAGVGFIAGLALLAALCLHGLVFGAAAARAAFSPTLARVLLGVGLVLALAGAYAPGMALAPALAEAGLLLVTVSGGTLVLGVLIGRAPTMRDEDW